ncbi:MAG TPA: CRTAC1 family protein [Gemmatimonadota bacterium]|nr:CRTAC1 family protein [Gemmatimonadota bacterium]
MKPPIRLSTVAVPISAALGAIGCGGEDPIADVGAFETAAPVVELVVPTLLDVTAESGLDFVHSTGAAGDKWMPETVGSGGGFLDYDGDGHLDIFLVNGRNWTGDDGARSALFRNRGDGTFVEVSAETGTDLHVYGMGAAFADYDGDGDIDIYVTAVGPNVLLRNDGHRFVDVTDRAGVHGNPEGRSNAWSTGAAWLDYDVDGDLDLFACNYVRWSSETDLFHTLDGTAKAYATPEPYEGDTCVLYRNEGPSRPFSDVTRTTGLWNPEGKALGIAVDDFDDDGTPDIFVTNDTEPNFLYMNRGDGSFEEVGMRAGVAVDPTGRARAGMGVDVADLEGDGHLAVAIGNFSHEAVSLYVQQSSDLFHDRAPAMGLARPTLPILTFGLRFVDLNLDGLDDIVLANGHIEPTVGEVRSGISFEQPTQVFLGTGDRFVEMTAQTGDAMTRPVVGRGLATGDVDGDGDPDILLTVNGGPARLIRNDLPAEGNRLRVVFGRPVIGAKVRVYAGGRSQRWYVTASGSYLSQSELSARTFGLGDAEAADSVVVLWPDGRRSVYREGLDAGNLLVMRHTETE